MALDATTFALEIVNFLVLLWLLHRFLYRPVQAALARREAAAAARAQAAAAEREALQARAAELDRRDAELAGRRDAAERELSESIAQQRAQRLAALDKELQAERDAARARLAREGRRDRDQRERQLKERAAAFVAQYLSRMAGPAVQDAVIALFLDDLAAQDEAARAAVRESTLPARGEAPRMEIATAFPVDDGLRQRVAQALAPWLACPAAVDWQRDPTLLAGIRVHLPGHQLEASLRRGVDAFAASGAVEPPGPPPAPGGAAA